MDPTFKGIKTTMQNPRLAAKSRRAFYSGGLLLACFALASCSSDEPTNTAVGTLAWDRVELVADLAEPITEIAVREGDRIAAGAMVISLDASRRKSDVAQATAGRDQALAKLNEMLRGPRREEIVKAEVRLKGARQVLKVRQRELNRVRDIVARKLASAESLDIALESRDQANTEVDSAKATLDELLAGTTAEELEQARQALAAAEAVLQRAQIDLSRLEIHAPQDGIVDSIPFQLGERPPAGAVVATLLAGRPYARVYVPEKIRVHVNSGTSAKIFVDGITDPFDANVRWVSADPSFTPYLALTERDRGRLSYLAKVDFVAKEELPHLAGGIPVTVEFPSSSATQD